MTKPNLHAVEPADAKAPLAPKHLSAATRAWWREVVMDFDLEPHHLRLLQAAGEAWDRAQEAREAIERDGPFFKNRFGELRSHPGLAVERDAKIVFARLLRELCLDVAVPESARPPRIGGR